MMAALAAVFFGTLFKNRFSWTRLRMSQRLQRSLVEQMER